MDIAGCGVILARWSLLLKTNSITHNTSDVLLVYKSSDTSAHTSQFVWSVFCLTLLDIKPTSFFTDLSFPSPTSQVCKKGQSRIRTNFHIYSRTKLMCQHMGYYSTFRWVIPRFRVGYLRVTNPFAMAASRYARYEKSK